jgi:hypothetical protein
MSRIWDALKNAERRRIGHAAFRAAGEQSKPGSERRRSSRLALCVPVLVYGHNPGEEPFHEFSNTTCVNADGGRLALTAKVQVDQVILLVNCKTEEEHPCRVVHVGQQSGGKRTVGFEIAPPESSFWGLVYDSQQRVWQSAQMRQER